MPDVVISGHRSTHRQLGNRSGCFGNIVQDVCISIVANIGTLPRDRRCRCVQTCGPVIERKATNHGWQGGRSALDRACRARRRFASSRGLGRRSLYARLRGSLNACGIPADRAPRCETISIVVRLWTLILLVALRAPTEQQWLALIVVHTREPTWRLEAPRRVPLAPHRSLAIDTSARRLLQHFLLCGWEEVLQIA